MVTVRLDGPRSGPGAYSGVDIIIYRVPEPMAFLKKQPNLHRVRVEGRFTGEGLANALEYVWDSWYKKSRLSWQRLFTADARAKVVRHAPELKQTPPYTYHTRFEDNPQFAPLPGFEMVARFRYPFMNAAPLDPGDGTALEGSSSEFTAARAGNIRLPLGLLPAGLYLVEGYVGPYRATTLVFVSDTVAVTKVSGNQLMVWTVHKKDGRIFGGAEVALTDATGTLESGSTDSHGVLVIERESPERTYVIGEDEDGGIFVSENFYYDSEIHKTKLYVFTDRPLYRPGDTVRFKVFGRYFQDSQHSTPASSEIARVTALDPNGNPVSALEVSFASQVGGDGAFELPDQSIAGGYTLLLVHAAEVYTASFRVAHFAKPHHDLDIVMDNAAFTTEQPATGHVRLSYPDGQPVQHASIELELRAQKLSMVEQEVRYMGRFPVALLTAELATGEDGQVAFTLPPAHEPSRYILRVIASDGGPQRVTANHEIVISAGHPLYVVTAAQHLTRPGEEAAFTVRPLAGPAARPARWAATRLEDRSRVDGPLAGGDSFAVRFAQPGAYTVVVIDENGLEVGSTPHFVEGPGLAAPAGSVTILLDQDEYRRGDAVKALIAFPEPVDEALITLERDRVHDYATLSRGASWLRLARLNPLQWRAEIPVTEAFSPNLTLSVLFVRNGVCSFQNKGIRVRVPRIGIAMTPDKERYAPGDVVTVAVLTTVDGEPTSTDFAVSVVDEMVYVLQPELAPNISDFFHHPRRNQVRTTSTLDFFTFDGASPQGTGEPPASTGAGRSYKVLERPRRDNIDTAAWFPRLKTDATGRGQFHFTMPDAIARWRMTARAITTAGQVGQDEAYIMSVKEAYLKWTGPTAFRQGDVIRGMMLGFNLGAEPRALTLELSGMGISTSREITLQPGANYLEVPLELHESGLLRSRLLGAGSELDQLETPIAVAPVGWQTRRSRNLELTAAHTALDLPRDARNVRLATMAPGAGAFLRVADELLDYPYGCVEQVASRLLPLSLVFRHVEDLNLSADTTAKLRGVLSNQRLRLARMAGPGADFGWWGDLTGGDPFFTAYAYLADRFALAALGIQAAPAHWEHLLEVYRQASTADSVTQRAATVWLASELKLPTRTLVEGVAADLARLEGGANAASSFPAGHSRLLDQDTEDPALAWAFLGLASAGDDVSREMAERALNAAQELAQAADPLPRALALVIRLRLGDRAAGSGAAAHEDAAALLESVAGEVPTIDRALTLVLLNEAVTPAAESPKPLDLAPAGPWERREDRFGRATWHHEGDAHASLAIDLQRAPAAPIPVVVTFDAFTDTGEEAAGQGVRLRRRLYRLEAEPTQVDPDYLAEQPVEWLYQATPVRPGEVISSTVTYVDEVRLLPTTESSQRFSLLEVPLPPGADLEPVPWGSAFSGIDGVSESAPPEQLNQGASVAGGYAVPVRVLESGTELTALQLVRFSQEGTFQLPAMRFFPMYRPGAIVWSKDTSWRSMVVR